MTELAEFGTVRPGSDDPVTRDSVFHVASLTKPVVARTVRLLHRNGRIGLDTPITSVLTPPYRHHQRPGDPDGPDDPVDGALLARVTPRHVLTHTTGWPNWARGPLRFQTEPGERWSYSGEGFMYLQRAIEATEGEPIDQVVRRIVFEPLGMDRSTLVWPEDRKVVQGADGDGEPRGPIRVTTPIAAGSLYSTVRDYATFVAAELAESRRFISEVMDHPVSASPEHSMWWGLGWGVERVDGRSFAWHWGSDPGVRAFVMLEPATGTGLVVLTASESGLAVARELAENVFGVSHPVFGFRMLS